MQSPKAGFSKLSQLLRSTSKQKLILIGVFTVALFVLGGYYSVAKSKFKPIGILNSSFGENTFTVSWFTEWKTPGSIEVSLTPDFENPIVFEDARDYDVNGTQVESQPRNSHVVIARKLEPEKKYYYRVKTQYNEVFSQSYQTVTTPKVSDNVQTPNPIYGEVVNKLGEPQSNVLVEIFVKENDGVESSRIVTYTQKNGTYSADLANLRRNNIDEFWSPTQGIDYKYVITARTNTESYFIETKDELTPVKTFAFESIDASYTKKDNSLASKLVGKAQAQSNTCEAEKKATESCFADYNYCQNLKGKSKPIKDRADFPGDKEKVFDDSQGPESCYNNGAGDDLRRSCEAKQSTFNTCVGALPSKQTPVNPNNQTPAQGEPVRVPALSNQTVATQRGCNYKDDNEVFKCIGSGVARAYDATCSNAKHSYANGFCDNYGGVSNPGAGDKCKMALEKGETCTSTRKDPGTGAVEPIVVTPSAKPAAPAPVATKAPTTPNKVEGRCDNNFAINSGKTTECSTSEICKIKDYKAVCEPRTSDVPVTTVRVRKITDCYNAQPGVQCSTVSGEEGVCNANKICEKPISDDAKQCTSSKDCANGTTCKILTSQSTGVCRSGPSDYKEICNVQADCDSSYTCKDYAGGKACLPFSETEECIQKGDGASCTLQNNTGKGYCEKRICETLKGLNDKCSDTFECSPNTTCKAAPGGKYCLANPTPTPKPGPGGAQQVLSAFSSVGQFNAKQTQVTKSGDTVEPGLYTSPGGTTLDLQAPTKVTFFVDANGNGKRDNNEQIVTDQAYQLVKQQDSFTYNVLNGWNALNFPFYKSETTMYKASEIVEEAAKQGIVIESIKSWDGNWVDYTRKDDKTYTADFSMYPNKGYFIKATTKGTFNLFGTTPTQPVPLQMLNGWTLVGVAPGFTQNKEKVFTQPEFRDGITAFEFIRTLNKVNPKFAIDNMTKYDSGIYRGVNYSKNGSGNFVEFGIDFGVENLESYFVRSYSKNIFTP